MRSGEGRARVAAALRTLDPFSFWVMPSPDARADDLIVAGTTGIFLVMPSSLSGVLQFGMTGAAIGTQKVADVGGLKRRAKALQAKLGGGRGLRGRGAGGLSHACAHRQQDRARRALRPGEGSREGPQPAVPARSPRGRAQRAARALGMHIAGDERRHFTPS